MNHTNKIISLIFEKAPADANDIIYALSLKNYTPTQIAEELGVDRTVVIHVIYRNKRSWNVATKISEILRVPLHAIFGDIYNYTPRNQQTKEPAGRVACNA